MNVLPRFTNIFKGLLTVFVVLVYSSPGFSQDNKLKFFTSVDLEGTVVSVTDNDTVIKETRLIVGGTEVAEMKKPIALEVELTNRLSAHLSIVERIDARATRFIDKDLVEISYFF